MRSFLSELKNRNKLLYWVGWICLLGALICFVLSFTTSTIVLGINAWIKPMKFFISSTAFLWTMGWYLHLLPQQKRVKIYSWMISIVLLFELSVICWQAANGRLSHFNISTKFYLSLFNAMGVAISILVFWTVSMTILFFRRKPIDIPSSYLWGIRLGLIFFIIFSFEGGIMAAKLSHTVGNPDGGEGIPFLNWSKGYGDLRVAHFFGMHALQILPLLGFYVFKKSWQISLFALLYLVFVVLLVIEALNKIPFIS